MKITLAHIASRGTPKAVASEALSVSYVQRATRYLPVSNLLLATEAALITMLDVHTSRTPTHLILLDSRGKLLSSEAFAAYLGQQRDTGTQHVMLAIGPADGWSDVARARAHLLLSLGPMTFPHELARVILAEQVYRAFTILAGHPYHTGH